MNVLLFLFWFRYFVLSFGAQGSDLFDPRLLKNVIKMVDVSYGGEAGFNQAIELSAETLGSVKLVQVCDVMPVCVRWVFGSVSSLASWGWGYIGWSC